MRCTLLLIFASTLAAQPLRELADQRGIRIGAAVDPTRFAETAYSDTLAREFSQIEPENWMKFGLIHPGPTTYSYAQPDAIAAFAKQHGQALRGHTLVWHQQLPAWVTNGNFTAAQLSDVLHTHIASVVGHYAGQVFAWDVVNEAFNDDGTLRGTIWYNQPGIGLTGTGYIEQAFRWAHEADPKALLFYNDYSAEQTNTKSSAIYTMVKDFRARGVPIDGVGLQMHFTASPGSLVSMDSNIRRLTDLGLQVHITELDVRLPVDSTGTASAANLATQQQIYRDIVALCVKFPLCTSIQTWGFTDKYSWIPGTFAGFGAGLPFDTSYRAKPARDGIASSLQNAPVVIDGAALANAASYAAGAISPGQISVLFNATFGPAALHLGPNPDLQLLFDGVPATLIYSRVGQVSAVVPFEIAGKSATELQYVYRGIASNTVTLPVKPATPGIFTLDATGRGAAAVLDSSFHVIGKDNPARRGDTLQVFATGGGVSPQPASAAIAGIDCTVTYSGPAPGLIAGALQVNVQVPSTVPSGEQPITIAISGAASQPGVTLAIQ